MDETKDVVIIGGGAGGLSAAVALGRFRRSVLVIDGGEPRNASSAHVHNLLTRDGTPPAELYAAARREAESYGVEVRGGTVRAVDRDGDVFRVHTDTDAHTDAGTMITARHVLVASGARDELPDVPGLAERWGRDVLHCPYCHGWEVRDQRVGVLARGPAAAAHQAQLFRRLTGDVVVLQHTADAFDAGQAEQLAARGIRVVTGEVVQVQSAGDRLTGVRLADGSTVELDALVVAPVCRARVDFLAPLGLEASPVDLAGTIMGTQLGTDATGATAVPGVWAVGNAASVQAQVVTSAAGGLTVAGTINAELVAAEVAAAVAAARADVPNDEASWDARYREHHAHIWSGRPNEAVVAELSELVPGTPGTALDAGAGEGGDAIWLASRGWHVTAAELSSVALERAEHAAKAAGVEVDWRHLDLTRDDVPGTYDLVTSSFLHVPGGDRAAVFGRLASAVAPGGTLLIVGHHPADPHTVMAHPGHEHMAWTAEELAAGLGPGWSVQTAATRERTWTYNGQQLTGHDAVLRARRSG